MGLRVKSRLLYRQGRMGLIQSRNRGSSQDDSIKQLVSRLNAEYPDETLAQFAYEFEEGLRPSPAISQCWLSLGSQEQWAAFGQLSFPKRHLILMYFPENICMQALSLECFYMFKAMELYCMESWLQRKSQKFDKMSNFHERKETTGVHLMYRCEINECAQISSLDMLWECEETPLQRAFGHDNVLRVHFRFTEGRDRVIRHRDVLHFVFQVGLQIGLRTYRLFGMKDERKKKESTFVKEYSLGCNCVFLCLRSEAEYDLQNESFRPYATIHDARQYLGHFHTVPKLSKRVSRMKLALSKTLQIPDMDFAKVKVQVIEDICCKDEKGIPVLGTSGETLITTDGTGFISEDIMRKCPLTVIHGRKFETDSVDEDFPLLMQMRLFHKGNIFKGVLLVNKQLPSNTIQVRPSMRKVENDPSITSPTFDSLEVCTTSHRPCQANIFQQLALLLLNGGVPENLFLKWAQERLDDLVSCFVELRKACKVLEPFIAERPDCEVAFRMLLAEIKVEEPFVSKVLSNLRKPYLANLSKCHFPVEGTYYLKGCADPTSILAPSQVVILREQPVIAEEILIYKAPGLHPGDVRKYQAVPPPKALREIVGFAKYGIFFSVHGERSEVDKMANADLDGDEFWICENQEIVKPFCVSPPWMPPNDTQVARDAPCEPEAFEVEHIKMCVKTLLEPSFIIGQAANNWLALMDKVISAQHVRPLSLLQKCLRLVDIYYKALDAEKTGKKVSCLPDDLKRVEKPHFMKSMSESKFKSYKSSSLLGKVYDLVKCPNVVSYIPVKAPIELDIQFLIPGHEKYCEKWREHLQSYVKDMKLACSEGHSNAKSLLCESVVRKYRQILYNALDLSSSKENISKIHMEASAIYKVVYTRAQNYQEGQGSGTSVYFAWRVAGDALLDIIRKPGWWSVSPLVMQAVYGRASLGAKEY